MAMQRVIVVKIAGDSAEFVLSRFAQWPSSDPADEEPVICPEADDFAENLRVNAHRLPIVFYCEWIDHWSSGDLVPSLRVKSVKEVVAKRYEICIHELPVEAGKDKIGESLTQECKWLRARIREASDAWEPICGRSVIVVVREVLGGLVMDEEVEASVNQIPNWLKS
jgi:hypothetical protein